MTGPGRGPEGRGCIWLGLPMAISVRDIVYSSVLPTLREAPVDIHVFTLAEDDPTLVEKLRGENVFIHRLRRMENRLFLVVENLILKVFVLILSLESATGRIMVSGTLRRNPLARLARLALSALGRRGRQALKRGGRGVITRIAPNLYRDLLQRHPPDMVVGTKVLTLSSRLAFEDPYLDRYLVLSAASQGVPTAIVVASWDNLTSKGFLPANVDRLLVWNETMHREAIELHGLTEDRVVVTGAPQHDVYARAPHAEREGFLESLGLRADRPLLVYATQTEGTVPDEPRLVERIHRALRDHLGRDFQLLIRAHQMDRGERYAALARHEDVHVTTAGSRALGAYVDRDFGMDGLVTLADTLAHADVVMNVASSISIDAAAVGTPVVCVMFDAEDGRPYGKSVRRYYDYTHQANVARSGGVRLASSPEALVEAVREYLDAPGTDGAGRERLVREQCFRLDGGSGRRVADALLAGMGAGVPSGARE